MGAIENGHRLVDLPPKNGAFPSFFLFTGGEGPHEFQDPKKTESRYNSAFLT